MATMSTDIEKLEAQLEAAREAEALTGDIDGEGGIYLTIKGEQFECRRVSVSWQMMKFAKAQRDANVVIPKGLPKDSQRFKDLSAKRNSAGMLMMAVMLETVNILLKPHERDRFDEFMETASMDGLEPNELENAIGEVIAAVGGEQGKAQQHSAQPSSSSSGTISENAPEGLSLKDTAEVVGAGQS